MKLFLLLLMLAITRGATAQNNSPEVLTNAKVISMVKGGLPKTVILKSIENKQANFDTSTDAMIALKKQGVPDDVITAMVSKAPNTAQAKPAAISTIKQTPADNAVPFNPVSTKDCKFNKVTMVDGSTTSMIQASGKLGNFMIGKVTRGISMNYKLKSLMAMFVAPNTKNLASLRIDSVRLLFKDRVVVTVKAFAGIGTLANQNDELKPHLTDIHFSLILEPGSKEDTLFKQSKLQAFIVIAEKDAQYADQFSDKQQDKLLQAFACIQ